MTSTSGAPAEWDAAGASDATSLTDEPRSPMLTALVRLRDALRRHPLVLETDAVEEARAERDALLHQLDDYVLPRLFRLDAPVLVVVGGSTGAGKSTLVNSLVGTRVTVPGVLRPTTRSPVLVHHPDDGSWFTQARVLPGLTRTQSQTNDQDALQLVATTSVPPGLALLDAPDVDSVEEANRTLAAQLLEAGDLWLFVTTAARYADQVPWDYLRDAADRSASVAVVLDRTAPEAVSEVSSHLARMLTARGLSDSPLFVVEEGSLGPGGLLPVDAVDQVRGWLSDLARDRDARAVVVRQTLDGAMRAVSRRAHAIADAAGEQVAHRGRLEREVEQSYADATAAATDAATDGSLLRGEALARWQELIGGGELLAGLEAKVSWWRERIGNAVRGRPQHADRVGTALGSGLQTMLLEQAEGAAESVGVSWSRLRAGSALLDGDRTLSRASRTFRADADREVGQWWESVLDAVRVTGADNRTNPRFVTYGVSALGAAVAVSSLTPGQGEGAAGTAASSPGGSARSLLRAVLGERDAARLVDDARTDLRARVARLLGREQQRFTTTLESVTVSADAPDDIRAAAREVDDERYAEKTARTEVSETPPDESAAPDSPQGAHQSSARRSGWFARGEKS